MNTEISLMDEISALCAEKNIPYSALLELTYKCNLKCFHCYNTPQNKKELNTHEIVDVMEQLADLGCLYLTLSGGEIYCRTDFAYLAKKAKSLGFALNIFTNATLMTPIRAKALNKLNIMEASVSIFSTDPNIHDAITRQPGSLKKTIQGLKLLADADVRTRIKCVIMKKNLQGYRNILELAKSLNAYCQFDTTLMPGNGNDLSVLSQRLDFKELKKVLSDPDVYHIEGNPLAYDGSHHSRVEKSSGNLQLSCSAGITYLSINPYGQVYSCVQQMQPAGDLRLQDLKTIWQTSPVFLKARGVTTDSLSTCSSCQHNSYCGRCPALAEKEDGDILGPSTLACKTSEVMHQIYSERLEELD